MEGYSNPEVRREVLEGIWRPRERDCSGAKPGCVPSLEGKRRAACSE